MKKKTVILSFFMLFTVFSSSSQEATIDGSVCASASDCQKYVCENSTIDLVAGITSGAVDSLVWRERIYDGANWDAYQVVSTNLTISVPVSEPATMGHTYRYQLIIYQGGNVYFALADMFVNAGPIATLLSDYTTICAGSTVMFTASAGGMTYDFNVNGISQYSGPNSFWSSSTLANGDQVTVTVTSGSCSATSSPISMIVNDLPTVTSVAGNAVPVCVGDYVNVEITGLTGSAPWQLEALNDAAGSPGTIYFDMGTVATPNATISVPVGMVGFNTKHLKITDSNGCKNIE